jgi:hypothetical protein
MPVTPVTGNGLTEDNFKGDMVMPDTGPTFEEEDRT